jgi:hypothetical protein
MNSNRRVRSMPFVFVVLAQALAACSSSGSPAAAAAPTDGSVAADSAATTEVGADTEPQVACGFSYDCPERTPACTDGKCGPCKVDKDCFWGKCEASTGLCACATSKDCVYTLPTCDTPSRRCVRCLSDSYCDGALGGPLCDTTEGSCVMCFKNEDCATSTSGTRCDNGRCVECATDADCVGNPKGPLCNQLGGPLTGTCWGG